MNFPIKPNDAFWPGWLRPLLGAHLRKDPRLLLSAEKLSDDAFSKAVSGMRLGGTFKTTRAGRHSASNELLKNCGLPEDTVVLDLGASDGITSLELMQALGFRFKRYYVTDRFFQVTYLQRGRCVFFFDVQGHCSLVADDFFVYYPEFSRLTRMLLGKRISRAEVFAREHSEQLEQVLLVHPRLLQAQKKYADKICIQSHDIFQPWQGEQPTLIKAANILNPGYFSASQLNRAFRLLLRALPEKGLFLLVENRRPRRDSRGKKYREEAAALYEKQNGSFVLLEQLGPPLEVNPC